MLEAENVALKRKRSPEVQLPTHPGNVLLKSKGIASGTPTPRIGSPSLQPVHQLPPDQSIQHINDSHSNSPIPSALKSGSDEHSLQPRYMGEASSETFGGRLHQFINHGERRPLARSHNYYKHPQLLRISCTECNLPNKNYARLLVRAVLRFIGGDHHLLLKKSFLQRLDDTYQLEVLDDPVWLCRLFTVLALGELYSVRGAQGTAKGTGVPGTAFFVKAMGYFQDMHEEPSVSYIETLLLLVS